LAVRPSADDFFVAAAGDCSAARNPGFADESPVLRCASGSGALLRLMRRTWIPSSESFATLERHGAPLRNGPITIPD
jgi:hypothetical protein